MTTNKPMISFSISQEMLDQVEDLFHNYRFKHRSFVFKWLIRVGLKQNEKPTEKDLKGIE